MDKISREARSRNMASIKSKNTEPEMLVRKALFREGFRFRIHYSLLGRPDIAFPSRRLAIFIHGCFWHGHNCNYNHIPKTNTKFWKMKIEANKKRDKICLEGLEEIQWETLVIWECSIRDRFNETMQDIKNALNKER